MKHVLVLNGNPDPGQDRLTHALARAYHEGAEARRLHGSAHQSRTVTAVDAVD